jgi:hypothetical protein
MQNTTLGEDFMSMNRLLSISVSDGLPVSMRMALIIIIYYGLHLSIANNADK